MSYPVAKENIKDITIMPEVTLAMCACAVEKTDTQARAFLPMLCPQEDRALIHSCKTCLLSPQVFESWPLRPDPV